MDTIDRAKFAELMGQARSLENGPPKVALFEEAVRLADLHHDVGLGFEARIELINAAVYGGLPEKALVAIAWCLARYDRDPQSYDEHALLQAYYQASFFLPKFPQISRQQIQETLIDLSARVERSGRNLVRLRLRQYNVAAMMWDEPAMHAAYVVWQETEAKLRELSPGYRLFTQVNYEIKSGRLEEAIALARPLIDGSLPDVFAAQITFPCLFLPLVKLGRISEAMELHVRSYHRIAGRPYYLGSIAEHLQFLVLTENLSKAVQVFESHLVWILASYDMDVRCDFSEAVRFLFETLAASGVTTLKLRLPSTFPLFNPSGDYAVSTLVDWFEADSMDLARAFDARNGNDSFVRQIDERRGLSRLVRSFPIPSARKRDNTKSKVEPSPAKRKANDGHD